MSFWCFSKGEALWSRIAVCPRMMVSASIHKILFSTSCQEGVITAKKALTQRCWHVWVAGETLVWLTEHFHTMCVTVLVFYVLVWLVDGRCFLGYKCLHILLLQTLTLFLCHLFCLKNQVCLLLILWHLWYMLIPLPCFIFNHMKLERYVKIKISKRRN